MNRLLSIFREYPAVAGVAVFLGVSVVLLVVLGTMMRGTATGLRPLVFFFGFLAIVGGPHAVVHLMDAWAHRQALLREAARAAVEGSGTESAAAAVSEVGGGGGEAGEGGEGGEGAVVWSKVFGADADPGLITDAKRGLDPVVGDALEARISFRQSGESALAARFEDAAAAARAMERYAEFFRFEGVTGNREAGWTARRHGGQGEWNHVVRRGRELYAWSGASREGVEGRRVEAVGPMPEGMVDEAPRAVVVGRPSKRAVSTRLSRQPRVALAFLGINLVLAVGWFFKAAAWCSRVSPEAGVVAVDAAGLRGRLLGLGAGDGPMEVRAGGDGRSVEITWRYADARWLDLMRANRLRRVHRLVLEMDEAARKVRVREYWSAFDASAGVDGVRVAWKAAVGIQLFQVDHRRIAGVVLDPNGRPTGEGGVTIRWDLQAMKAPVIAAVTGSGWTWQPVVWSGPAGLRWLTE
jgi:hypothetical protein